MRSKKIEIMAIESEAYDAMLGDIRGIVSSMRALHLQTLSGFAPIVHNIIQEHCRDAQHIQLTLDSIFDCAGLPEGLLLYKKLCRYYFDIDPETTARYVYDYRDWYENDDASDLDDSIHEQ
jgi:hypothetical protein